MIRPQGTEFNSVPRIGKGKIVIYIQVACKLKRVPTRSVISVSSVAKLSFYDPCGKDIMLCPVIPENR